VSSESETRNICSDMDVLIRGQHSPPVRGRPLLVDTPPSSIGPDDFDRWPLRSPEEKLLLEGHPAKRKIQNWSIYRYHFNN